MPITGSLEEASLPDVLQLLSLARKTGCLSVTDRLDLGRIFVDDGRVTYASVANRPDRLGAMLVKSGTISPAELEEAIARQARHRDRKIGEVLLERGRICRADLEQSLRKQIEEAVYALLGWTRGRFTFQSDVRPQHQDLVVSIGIEALMLEGARRIDEWRVIEKKIPSFDIVFQVAQERLAASNATLTAEQRVVADLIDGERDVTQLVDESGLSEFEVAKAVYGLAAAGLVRALGRSGQGELPGVVDEPSDEERTFGRAFYRAGMYQEARRVFEHVLESAASDLEASFHLGLVAFREGRLQDAIAHFETAATSRGPRSAVLHNLALCYERAGRSLEAETHAAEAVSGGTDDPRVLTGWAILALNRGEDRVAIARLDRARLAAGDAPAGALWYWARSLAAARVGDLKGAERILRQGLEEQPRHVVLLNNLAVLLELHGQFARAEATLQEALTDDSSVPQVSKNVGDLAYRSARYDAAWEAYQRAIRLSPGLGGDVYFRLGNIAMKRAYADLAWQYWHKALALNPEHAGAAARLAREAAPIADSHAGGG